MAGVRSGAAILLLITLSLQSACTAVDPHAWCDDPSGSICAAREAPTPAGDNSTAQPQAGKPHSVYDPETPWEYFLNPWFWSPFGAHYSGFHWPDYTEDIPRWTSFLLLVAFLLLWVGILPDTARL